MLPGVILAVYDQPGILDWALFQRLILALVAIGFVASSNYVINEIIDAPFDAQHPVKCHRPVPSGEINIKLGYIQWIFLAVIGLSLAAFLGVLFFSSAACLWIMGCVYNIPPLRSKDKAYIDVLTEAVNNPLRLMAGWYAAGMVKLPPVSLIIAYWMVGAFFMAVKRFAEYRKIADPQRAFHYRNSFGHYNEERLLISVAYYAVAFGLFFGVFIMRYRLELLLSFPLIAGFIGWYIHLGFMVDSPAQYPEKLYRQRGFVLYSLLCVGVMLGLLFVDVPMIRAIFSPTIRIQ